ncbi:MAG: GNAT family N-acetyltransferase [Burkholderiaceae bacterium]|nr:GNAT family N-acetyltransferase [Burkholderiaceae bacterium]
MALHFVLLDGRLHDRAAFSCGIAPLDAYLRLQAGQHQRDGIATTHVLADDQEPSRILGYCSLAAAQLHLHDLQPADRRRLPSYPIPALRIGRLAVSADARGKGYGRLLLGHAANRAVALRETLGVRVLLVDAKDERAAAFYAAFGFRPTSDAAMTLYLPIGRG